MGSISTVNSFLTCWPLFIRIERSKFVYPVYGLYTNMVSHVNSLVFYSWLETFFNACDLKNPILIFPVKVFLQYVLHILIYVDESKVLLLSPQQYVQRCGTSEMVESYRIWWGCSCNHCRAKNILHFPMHFFTCLKNSTLWVDLIVFVELVCELNKFCFIAFCQNSNSIWSL